jgi:hypothetical protein
VTTFLENMEMSGILVIVREMSGIMIKVREMSGECQRISQCLESGHLESPVCFLLSHLGRLVTISMVATLPGKCLKVLEFFPIFQAHGKSWKVT